MSTITQYLPWPLNASIALSWKVTIRVFSEHDWLFWEYDIDIQHAKSLRVKTAMIILGQKPGGWGGIAKLVSWIYNPSDPSLRSRWAIPSLEEINICSDPSPRHVLWMGLLTELCVRMHSLTSCAQILKNSIQSVPVMADGMDDACTSSVQSDTVISLNKDHECWGSEGVGEEPHGLHYWFCIAHSHCYIPHKRTQSLNEFTLFH